MHPDFQKLLNQSQKIALLHSVEELLDWDKETYMPKEGAHFRSLQIELIAFLVHKEKRSSSFMKALSRMIDLDTGEILSRDLSTLERRALIKWRKEVKKALLLPSHFVKRFAKLTTKASMVWAEAKEKKELSLFLSHLKEIVELVKEKISYLGYKEDPYDALLDEFEPEMKTKELLSLFAEIRAYLPSFLKELRVSSTDSTLCNSFSKKKQMELCQEILKRIGFDGKRGRLDLSNHPFSSTFHPTDSRITTRLDPDNLMEGISATLHEAGHSFYEMGMDPTYFGSPLCEGASLGIHESQSRFWETILGQSLPFWTHFYPLVQHTFPDHFNKIPLEQFYSALNAIVKTPIRIASDEVSYSLHILVRFELEWELVHDKLDVKDLSEAWRAKMEKYLGITPKDDAEGCLQDIHWSIGAFGYFPTYALGNLYAATLFESLQLDTPNWKERVEKGEFDFIRTWLQEKIYRYGSCYTSKELIKMATGKELSPKPYFNYLTLKYRK